MKPDEIRGVTSSVTVLSHSLNNVTVLQAENIRHRRRPASAPTFTIRSESPFSHMASALERLGLLVIWDIRFVTQRPGTGKITII